MTETDRQTERLENILFLIVITFLAMAMRFFLFPIESGDYLQFLHPWYETLKENGGFACYWDGYRRLHAAVLLHPCAADVSADL